MRTFKAYETKNINIQVKDIDTVGRRVKIALSAYDVIDSDRDVIKRGAFSKSIQERGPESQSNRKISFLRYHDWEHQIGKFMSLEETNTHLVAVAEMGRSTKANDAFLDYQDGMIREHSIGFNYILDKMQMIGEGDDSVFEIKEVFLWEGSAVTFGANSLTPTLDVSKGNKTEVLQMVNEQMNGVIQALRNGAGTDERLYNYEMQLKVLQEKYNSLVRFVQPEAKTSTAEVPQSNDSAAKSFYLYL